MKFVSRFLNKIEPPSYLNDALFFLIVGVFVLNFVINLNIFEVPNSDIFAFINDSKYYLKFDLPPFIHLAPITPILIGIVSKFIGTDYPELISAYFINSFSIICFLIVTWEFVKKNSSKFVALLMTIFLVCHPLLYFAVYEGMPEPLFVLLVAVSLLLSHKNKKVSYLICGLSFLVRYEAIALFLSYFMVDAFHFFRNRKVRKYANTDWIWGSTMCILIIVTWLAVVCFNNSKSEFLTKGLYYLHEVKSRADNLPEKTFIMSMPKILFFRLNVYQTDNLIIPELLLLMLSGAIFFIPKNKQRFLIEKKIYLFTIFYFLIHISFPAFQIRYLFPILFPLIWMIFLNLKLITEYIFKKELAKHICMFLISLFFIAISYSNFKQITPLLSYGRTLNRLEYKELALWMNNENFQHKKTVILLLPWISEYFLRNDQIRLMSPKEYPECKNIACIADKINLEESILVGLGSSTENIDQFGIEELNILALHDEREIECLSLIKEIRVDNRNLILYEFDYELCNSLNIR